MRLPRMTTRRLMIVVALSALLHETLADLCRYEETIMRRRAESCAARWRRGAARDEPGEEAETLRYGPYAGDMPKSGSWAEQAAIWDRAADRARAAAAWHDRMSDYYNRVGPTLMPARPR